MDKEAVEDLFDISSEQLACVNGAEPGMGLIRFGDKIVPLDNTIEKDNNLYQLFNTNFHEMVLDEKVLTIRYTVYIIQTYGTPYERRR